LHKFSFPETIEAVLPLAREVKNENPPEHLPRGMCWNRSRSSVSESLLPAYQVIMFFTASITGKGAMRTISFIEDQQVIREILTHLGLRLVRSRPPPAGASHADRPKICAATLLDSKASDSYTHTPHPNTDAYADPEYSWDDYIHS